MREAQREREKLGRVDSGYWRGCGGGTAGTGGAVEGGQQELDVLQRQECIGAGTLVQDGLQRQECIGAGTLVQDGLQRQECNGAFSV